MKKVTTLLLFVFLLAGCQAEQKTRVVNARADFPDTYFPKPAVWMEIENVSDSKLQFDRQYQISYASSDTTYWKGVVECETKGLRARKKFYGQCHFVKFVGRDRESLEKHESATVIIDDVSTSEAPDS